MRRVALAVLTTLVTGCVSHTTPALNPVPVPSDRILAFQQPIDGGATVIAIRDEGLIGSICSMAFFINGAMSARYKPGETATFYVEPGELVLRYGIDSAETGMCASGNLAWIQRETTLKAGEAKAFRLTIDQNAVTDIVRSDVAPTGTK